MTLGENIKKARKKAGYTQAELAKIIGKGTSTLQKYEMDILLPPVTTLAKISQALNTPLEDLLSYTKYQDPIVGLKNDEYEVIAQKIGLSKRAVDQMLKMGIQQLTTGVPILTLLNTLIEREDFRDLLGLIVSYINKEEVVNSLKHTSDVDATLFDSVIESLVEQKFLEMLVDLKNESKGK